MKMLNAALLGCALLVNGLTKDATAADLWPTADMDLKSYNWSGFSIAPYFGYETLHLKGAGSAAFDDPDGWRIGGEIDYDKQYGNLVLGVSGEAYYTWYDSNGKLRPELSANMQDYGSLRGKIGYATGRWLFYGTGGYAFGDLTLKDGLAGLSDRHTLNGWTAGGGVEWVWNDRFTLRGEYDHYSFGSENFSSIVSGPQDVGADLDLFKIAVIARF